MTKFKILCDIDDNVNFNIGGISRRVDLQDLEIGENIKRIYRIQFSKAPSKKHLTVVLKVIENNPHIDLRFYGNYSEDQIEWNSLGSIERLQIDLWHTNQLKEVSHLTNLKRLAITKNVKSSVSLSILENLKNLDTLFVSISRDIQSISQLHNLRFLSLREIKANDLDFLKPLKQLDVLWLSLGSYVNFKAISQIESLKKLSLHQVRGFDDLTANETLGGCEHLDALQLQDLKHIHSLGFLSKLRSLKYLQMEGLRNIETYQPILDCRGLETLLATGSRPRDKSLKGLINVRAIGLGDSYSKEEIGNLLAQFTGAAISIGTKELVGKLHYENQFII